MNALVTIKTHGEPTDNRGPFHPVRAAIRHSGRAVECHRCGEINIPDLIHLADELGIPLCSTCTRHVSVSLRRGLQTLNQLAHALARPDAHPAEALVSQWLTTLAIAQPEEQRLLKDAAQLLAEETR